jgi:transposase
MTASSLSSANGAFSASGQTMEVIDGTTGEIHRAEVFVVVPGASSYLFAQATWTQSLPDSIGAHVNMLAFIGGVARQIVSVR